MFHFFGTQFAYRVGLNSYTSTNLNGTQFVYSSDSIRTSGTQLCSDHKKPTYTGRIIHSISNQSYHCKFNTAVNLKEKWTKLPDSPFHDDVIKELKLSFLQNGYDRKFIDSVLNFKPRHVTDKPKREFFSIPFTGQSSFIIRKFLYNNLDLDISITLGRHNALDDQISSKNKDPIPLEKRSGVVQCIPCSGCPKVYVLSLIHI